MRTILIPLILICSLTQFEQGKKYDDCEEVFKCFAPESCTDLAKKDMQMDQVDVVRFDGKQDITDDCPAIVRYHLYANHWAHVEIRSLQDNANLNSIELVQEDGSSTPNEMLKLSCILDNGAMKGMYTNKVKYVNDKIGANDKLECIFQVRTDREAKVIANYDKVFIRTNQGLTRKKFNGNNLLPDAGSCDPSNLKFFEVSKEDSKKALYDKIKFEPGKILCGTKPYHFEYRKKDQTKHEISEITCNQRKFVLKDSKGVDVATLSGSTEMIDVRCASEAKYHCKYEPKAHGTKKAPDFTPPNVDSKTEATLKCPGDKPILNIVRGKTEKAILKPYTIECENFGNKQLWVVKDQKTNDQKLPDQKLTETGLEVYCSDTVDCTTQFKLSNWQVKNGILDQTKFLPQCSAGGKLLAGDKEVLEMGCNEKTGKSFYMVEAGKPVDFDTTTQFVCKFEVDVAKQEKKNADDKKFVWTGVSVAGVLAVVVVIGIGIVIWRVQRHMARRKKRKQAARDTAIYDRFCVGPVERNKIAEKAAKKKTADEKAEKAKEKAEQERLAKQSGFAKFVEGLKAKKKGKAKQETSKEVIVCERKEGALPTTAPEIKQANKWTKWEVDRMLRAQKIARVRKGKMGPAIPIDELEKLRYTYTSMDKKKNPPVKFVVKETEFIEDQKNRGFKPNLQIGAVAKKAVREEVIERFNKNNKPKKNNNIKK